MKIATSNTTTYKYDAREILSLISKDLNVPTKALSFTINPDGSYNITCNNEQVPKSEPYHDPYDAYRDVNGRLPSSMW
jgi:hypothetical protein